MKEIPNCQNESKVINTQCGNQRIFLSLRFLREINFGETQSSKTAVFAILGALNLVNLVNFSLQKVQKN